MVEKLKRWPSQLWRSLENLLRTEPTNQPVFIWRFWLGLLATPLVILYIELGRRAGIVMPVPFLILLASVVLAANLAGILTGLVSAALAVTFIIYSATISFGPPTLTGGPFQVMLGALLYFMTAYFLGRTKSQNRSLIRQLQTYQESLENLVEARTNELNQTNQAVGVEAVERKQAEEYLRESEARYRAIIEIQTEFVARSKPEGTLTFVNEAYCHHFEQTREQLLGTNFMQFLIEEDRQAVCDKFASLTPDNPVATDEHQEYRSDGTIGWYQWTDHGIFDQEGQLIEVQSVGRDISRRKQIEEELRRSEERFQRLAEAAFEGIGISDKGIIIDVNDQLRNMLGYESGKIIGMNAMDFVAPESRELVQKHIMSGHEGPYEHMALRKDGSTFPVEVRGRAFPYKGHMIRVTVIRDITRQKQAEAARRRSEERFSAAFHLNPSAIAITTLEEGRYLDVNKSFLKIHGYRREEVVGRTSTELNLWVNSADRVRIVEALRKDGRVQNVEIPFRVKSGEIRLALTSLEIIELDQEQCILSMFLDITERKQLEEQFRQAQKIEAIGQLTAGIAHDFNNRLLVVNGLAELMRLDQTLNDSHQESLK